MVSLDFTTGLNHYGYDVGVNAANLTYDDITRANARLKPFRQQRIRNGLLKATRDEASTIAPAPAVATADTSHLVHYAKWTKKELVKAILGRQLKSATKAKSMIKSDMVATLEKADKNPQFSCFLDLSPELRNLVYGLAIADANPKGLARVRPETPAISRTNRQLRTESLPLFFRNTCMTVIVSAGPSRSKTLPQRRTSRTHSAEITKEYMNYFIHAERVGWLQHMRYFQWRITGLNLNRNGDVVRRWNERFFVRFSSSMQTVETWMKEEDRKNRLEAIQAEMAEITDGASTSMTPLDFYAMMASFMASVVRRTPN